MHLERISFFVSFAVLQILIDLVNIDARKEVELRVENAFTYESTGQFDVIGIERFDSLDSRTYQHYQSNFGVGSRSPITGTYSDLEIATADVYGGATSTGKYPFARSNTRYSLRLNKAADFFGLWVSSADNSNIVRFFYHGEKVFEYSVKSVLEGLGEHRAQFKGNPTFSNWWGGRGNSGEEYLFINAFFNNVFYDQVQFVQRDGGCFESDNHAVGNWTQTSGKTAGRHVMTETW